MVTAVASVLTNQPVSNLVAMTGEVTIRGLVRAVGGIVPKVRAAGEAGVKKVLIPKENWQESFALQREVEVVPVSTIQEVLEHALLEAADQLHLPAAPRTQGALLGAFPKITPGIIP